MSVARSKLLFAFGIFVFVLAKLYLVLPTTAALAIPRIGDDALVYLWKGRLVTLEKRDELPAIKDITLQRFLDDNPPAELAWQRSNVTQRVLGTAQFSYDRLAAGALAVAPDLRWAFALTELLGVIVMAAGMGWFLLEVCGPAVAGVAMMIMAFAVLPNQGIYSFIPSTLSLSGGLMLWAYLWRRGADSRSWVVLLLALPILGLHPIAKIYIALAPAILWLRLGRFRDWRAHVLKRVALACAGAIVLVGVLPLLIPSLQPPPSAIMGGVSLTDGVSRNISAAWNLLPDPILRKNLLWALLLAGALIIAPKASVPRPLAFLLIGTLALLLLSLIFWLPGYPAELFSRTWVLFALFGSAAGAGFIVHVSGRGAFQRHAAFAVMGTGVLLSAVFWTASYVPHTMNWRHEVLVENAVRTQLEAFPPNTTLLYADATIALQASLLLGGYRLGALAYPMLTGSPSLDMLVSERRPPAIVTPGLTSLNSLAARRTKSFVHRRQGLYFPVVDRFVLRINQGSPLDGLRLLLESEKGSAYLRWQAFDDDGRALNPAHDVVLPAKKSWVVLPVPARAASIWFSLPDVPAWLLGLGSRDSSPRLLWPWKAGWSLTYGFRGKGDDKLVQIDFTPRALLNQVRAERLVSLVDTGDPVLADDSGLVFLRTKFNHLAFDEFCRHDLC